jgi:hypothetical protein
MGQQDVSYSIACFMRSLEARAIPSSAGGPMLLRWGCMFLDGADDGHAMITQVVPYEEYSSARRGFD